MYEDVDGVCGALGDFTRARFISPCRDERIVRESRVHASSTGAGKKLQWPVDVGNMRGR